MKLNDWCSEPMRWLSSFDVLPYRADTPDKSDTSMRPGWRLGCGFNTALNHGVRR
jgi:hypothetical protein